MKYSRRKKAFKPRKRPRLKIKRVRAKRPWRWLRFSRSNRRVSSPLRKRRLWRQIVKKFSIKSGKTSSKYKTYKKRYVTKGKAGTMKKLLKWFFILSIIAGIGLGVWVVQLDSVVREKFEGRRWALPAWVFARPLDLYVGQKLDPKDLERELKDLGYKWRNDVSRPGSYQKSGQNFAIYARAFRFTDSARDAKKIIVRFSGGTIVSLRDGNNKNLSLFRMDPVKIGGVYPKHNEDRRLVKLEQVPETLIKSLVVVEDRNFYTHHGVSPKAILRAIKVNVQEGGMVQGGSTLTQQLVKNFLLTSDRKLTRKIKEAFMALLVDFHYDKDEILEMYLNEVYLGQSGRRAVHGFGLAAYHYFGKQIENLSLEEQALLVGMVKGPTYYNPRRNPDRAKKRRDLVLDLLAQQDVIDGEKATAAKAKPLNLQSKGKASDVEYPAYLDLVREQLRQDYRDEDLTSEGLRIFTSFDPQVQFQAEQSLVNSLGGIKRRFGKSIDEIEGAVVITDTQTGEVLALVGGRRPRYFGFNRALKARRQVGSLIKPAVYLTALEQSRKYNLASIVNDGPVYYEAPNGQVWEPKNFDHKDHGEVMLSYALSRSLNQSAAQIGLDVGIPAVTDTLRRLGVTSDIPQLPSIFLGTVALTPLEVASMYQTLAGEGFNAPLRAIRGVTTNDGQLLNRYSISVDERFNPEVIYLMQFALQMTMREGTGRYAYTQLSPALNLAGKTGTTNDGRDSWFSGFSGDRLAVVWLGRDDNGATPLTGSSGALRVWTDIMKNLPIQSLNATIPDNILTLRIDRTNGLPGDKHRKCRSRGTLSIPFIKGSEPQDKSDCIKANFLDIFEDIF